jgi:hypothetical protein
MAACWRIPSPTPMRYAVESIARAESRSVSNALLRLIKLGITAYGRTAPVSSDRFDDDAARRSTIVVRHLPPSVRAGINTFAQIEDRSLSSATKILLREALRARGIVPGIDADRVQATTLAA